MMGMIALVVDLGYLYWNQRALQSSADAASLAGAMELPDRVKAEAVARNYGTGLAAKNHNTRMVVRRRVGHVQVPGLRSRVATR